MLGYPVGTLNIFSTFLVVKYGSSNTQIFRNNSYFYSKFIIICMSGVSLNKLGQSLGSMDAVVEYIFNRLGTTVYRPKTVARAGEFVTY